MFRQQQLLAATTRRWLCIDDDASCRNTNDLMMSNWIKRQCFDSDRMNIIEKDGRTNRRTMNERVCLYTRPSLFLKYCWHKPVSHSFISVRCEDSGSKGQIEFRSCLSPSIINIDIIITTPHITHQPLSIIISQFTCQFANDQQNIIQFVCDLSKLGKGCSRVWCSVA
jgi:hypothetical protein